MNIISTIKSLTLSEIFRTREMVESPPTSDLVDAVECARRDWQLALKEIDHIDSDLDEYIVFRINAAERRYMALLEQARKEGLNAWPPLPGFTFENDEVQAASNGSKNEPLCTG